MNYSTLKKTAALSFAALLTAGMVSAQTDSTKAVTTTTMSTDTTMSSGTTGAKVFGGRGQYKTFSIGINGGVTSPFVAIGGVNDWEKAQLSYGYGLSLRSQLAHSFGLQLDLHGGQVKGRNDDGNGNAEQIGSRTAFATKFLSATLSGVVNVATIDYIRRKNAINFFITGGAGLAFYHPSFAQTVAQYNAGTGAYDFFLEDSNGNPTTPGQPGSGTSKRTVKELIIPIGAGVKFKLSDAVALNLGYTMNFIDGYNFDGTATQRDTRDKFSYGYAGLEFTLGGKGKPNLDWVNPVAMMYDELYDETLRQEVAALKTRVTNVENAVTDLKKDSDGDGVADQFDKCPNTPANSIVDGSGCVIVFPTPAPVGDTTTVGKAYSNIQFEFDSSVLRTSSYPALDATSADLRASGATTQVNGYASSEGTAAHNLSLSRDRANSVKTYLVNSGVAASKLKVKAYGETNPIADNSTEEGRVLNRRVSFTKK